MWIMTVVFVSTFWTTQSNLTFNIHTEKSKLSDDQIIFTADYNITKVLVASYGDTYALTSTLDIPTIFFTANHSKFNGGSCVYVLDRFTAYEVLEGGRDSTTAFKSDKVFIGAKDGLYRYNHESRSAEKVDSLRDDIVQLQAARGSDDVYILTSKRRIYKVNTDSTTFNRTRIEAVACALQFVLDSSHNIYYVACDGKSPFLVANDGSNVTPMSSDFEQYNSYMLLRPAFIMENCVPVIADGFLYIFHANGTITATDFYIDIYENISAYSIDAALYLVMASNRKIYEFNVMNLMLTAMFRQKNAWPNDITRIITNVMEYAKQNVFSMRKLEP